MFKTLLKKEFLAFAASFGGKAKAGKTSSPIGGVIIVGGILVFFLGGSFFVIFSALAPEMIKRGLQGLFFSFATLLAFAFSLIGSVAFAKARLYESKDDDILLSMPIPPKYILLARLVPLFSEILLFQLLVFLPALIAYYLNATISFNLILQIVFIFAFSLFVMALSCLIGRLFAIIAQKAKRKTLVSLLLYFVFFAFYFWFMTATGDDLEAIVENADEIEKVMSTAFWIIYQAGLGMSGKILPFLVAFLISSLFFALVFFRLSKTYVKTVTYKGGAPKKEIKEGTYAQGSLLKALLYKEWKRLSSSATYITNGCIGCLFSLFLGVVTLVKGSSLDLSTAFEQSPELLRTIPFYVIFAISALSGFTTLSAPSISLEGKNLWIIKSMPIPAEKALLAKYLLHVIVTTPFSLFFGVCLSIGMKLGVVESVIAVTLGLSAIPVQAFFGILCNLKWRRFDWTSEIEPIKQGGSIIATMLLNFVFPVVIALVGILSALYFNQILGFFLTFILLLILNVLALRYLKNKGARKFAAL